MKTKLLSVLFICTGATLFAQTPDKAKLDSYFAALESNNKLMGTVNVSKEGKTIYSKSIGYLDAEKKTPIKENTKFRIGSISKTFTAAMIFKAIEEKKLTLDTKLAQFYPGIPNASKITVGQLLNHHSGIHNFTNDASFQEWYTTTQSEADMVSAITKGGSDFEPGSKGAYSNSNFVLLSYILERTYKSSYKDLVQKMIIKPLGLKNTFYGSAINTGANEAMSYKYDGGWIKEKDTDMSVPMGAGAMVSTPADLSRFLEGLFAGKVVTQTSLNQMKTLVDGYGMGLFQFPYESMQAFGHNGAIDGFKSVALYVPEDKVTVTLTSNGAVYDTDAVGITALDWVYNKPFEIPDFTSYSYQPEELDKYRGVYSSAEMPLKITITRSGITLIAQATGQMGFPLDAGKLNTFTFDSAGIVLEFTPAENKMILKQGGKAYNFKKD